MRWRDKLGIGRCVVRWWLTVRGGNYSDGGGLEVWARVKVGICCGGRISDIAEVVFAVMTVSRI